MDSMTKCPRTYRPRTFFWEFSSHRWYVPWTLCPWTMCPDRDGSSCAIMIQTRPLDGTLRSVSFPDCIAGLYLKLSGKGQYICNNINSWGKYFRSPIVSCRMRGSGIYRWESVLGLGVCGEQDGGRVSFCGQFNHWPRKRQDKTITKSQCPDPDPLFSSAAFEIYYVFLFKLTVGTFTTVTKDNKSVRRYKTRFFLNFFDFWWKDPDPYPYK